MFVCVYVIYMHVYEPNFHFGGKVSFWQRGVLVAACVVMCGRMLQCGVMRYSMLQHVAVSYRIFDQASTGDWLSHVTLLIQMCDMSHQHIWWLIHPWRDSVTHTLHCPFTHGKTFTRDMTHSHVWYDSWMYDMPHLYTRMTWLIHLWHNLFTYRVATMSRRLKIIGLFCRISSLL